MKIDSRKEEKGYLSRMKVGILFCMIVLEKKVK